jgi:L-iditol 2-dehydrogenase
MTMKSAWIVGEKSIEIRDIPYREPGVNEIAVQVKACGLCGTDLHFYSQMGGENPIPIGHEVAGVVHRCGEGSDHVKEGDPVVVQNHIPCGKCYHCLQGRPAYCSDIKTYMNDQAALSEYLIVDKRMVIPFSDLSFVEATIAEPLTVALDLMDRACVEPYQKVCVSGPGIIGLCTTMLASQAGAATIVTLGRKAGTARGKKRLEMAGLMGADVVIDTETQDWQEQVREQAPGGFDKIIITSPPQTITPLFPLAAFGADIVYNGINFLEDTISFHANDFHFNKLRLIASHAIPNWGFPQALNLLAERKVPVTDLATHTFALEQLEEAFRVARSEDDEVIKVVVTLD